MSATQRCMSGAARACQPQARQTTPTLLCSLVGLSPSWSAAPRLCAIVAWVCHAAGQRGRGSRVRRGQVHLPVLVPHAPREVPVAAGGSTLKITLNLPCQLLHLPLIHCMNTLLRYNGDVAAELVRNSTSNALHASLAHWQDTHHWIRAWQPGLQPGHSHNCLPKRERLPEQPERRACWWWTRRPAARSCAQTCPWARPGTPRSWAPLAPRNPPRQTPARTLQANLVLHPVQARCMP